MQYLHSVLSNADIYFRIISLLSPLFNPFIPQVLFFMLLLLPYPLVQAQNRVQFNTDSKCPAVISVFQIGLG